MSEGLPYRIAASLRGDIILGVYPVGSRLPPERELSRRYGASRFAVREAIASLVQGGFVETLPQSGTYIRDFEREGPLEVLVEILKVRRSIDRRTLDSLLEFRFASETAAAAEAARRLGPEELARLRSCLDRKRAALGDRAALTASDYDFHFGVICASGNVITRLVFQSFRPIYSFFCEFFYGLEGAAEASLALNERLAEALGRAEPEEAREAMAAILRFAEASVHEAVAAGTRIIAI